MDRPGGAGRAPRYAGLLPVALRPLSAVLRRHGLDDWAPLRTWLAGLCQITVQCGPDEAEAAYALAAIDYYWRGTGHVRGGLGALAAALVTAIERAGGKVHFADRVQSLRPGPDGGWTLHTRQGEVQARQVVANLLPADLAGLLGGDAGLDARHRPVADGWGAVMLYRVVRGVDGPAHHLDLTVDPAAPLVEGNHVFVSVGGPEDGRGDAPGERVLTASTHLALARLREGDPAATVAAVQARMRATLSALAPELDDVVREHTASPRTFQRFVRRREGAVGGVPRRTGWAAWTSLGPVSPRPGLWLVGDSVFPGQSTLAVALGGVRVAEAVVRAG